VSAVIAEARQPMPDPFDGHGYRGTVATVAAGITYRQLDYWARTNLLGPTLPGASGGPVPSLYSFRDIIVLKIVKRLLDAGVSLHNIRAAINHVRSRTCAELAVITLMSDGASVYECTSPEEVVELVHTGQGIFGISVGAVWREIAETLGQLPAEVVGDGPVPTPAPGGPVDELALRRRSRVG
jgi:DNA-binding transcriptional MerR regulator